MINPSTSTILVSIFGYSVINPSESKPNVGGDKEKGSVDENNKPSPPEVVVESPRQRRNSEIKREEELKRNNISREILTTEKTYLQRLIYVIQVRIG